jgi:hypothetical protein
MKRLILIFVMAMSLNAYSQTSKQRLEDIEIKLDSIREEQEWRDFHNKVDKDGREFDRQMNEQRRLREKNRESPYIVLNDGTVIDADKHIENGIRNQYRKDLCRLTWNGKRFTKDDFSKDNFGSVRFRGIMPLEIFFQNNSYDEIQKILQSSSNQKEIIKLCPVLQDYKNIIDFYISSKRWQFR